MWYGVIVKIVVVVTNGTISTVIDATWNDELIATYVANDEPKSNDANVSYVVISYGINARLNAGNGTDAGINASNGTNARLDDSCK